jgi:hypothetical protein
MDLGPVRERDVPARLPLGAAVAADPLDLVAARGEPARDRFRLALGAELPRERLGHHDVRLDPLEQTALSSFVRSAPSALSHHGRA